MLYIEAHASNSLERHPGGKGKGRPPRIAARTEYERLKPLRNCATRPTRSKPARMRRAAVTARVLLR